MVAPPGPVSAEALMLTFVRPPDGPCTATCVAIVSPRALDKLMEVVVPGASFCPTLTKRGDTHTGYACPEACPTAIKDKRKMSTAAVNAGPFTRRRVLRVTRPISILL